MKSKRFRVAAVQMDLSGTPSDILRRALAWIKKAKAAHADIICLPEHTLSDSPKKNLAIIKRIQEECKESGVWCIVAGKIRERKRVYNSAILIDDKGRVTGRHRKVHICDPGVLVGGSSFGVYDTPFCKIGIAICWDISHPEALYTMAKKGAKVIFCPMYWLYDTWAHKANHSQRERKILESLLLSRAFENVCYVVFSNAYNETHEDLVPYSGIAEPHRIIKEIFNKEGMIVSDIDLGYLNSVRTKYRRHYRRDLT